MKPNFLGNRQAASPVLSQFVSRLAALALVGQCTVIALSHDAAEMPSVPDVSGNVFTRGETELHRALEDGRIASSGYQTDANILYLTGGDWTDYAQERRRLDVYYPTDQRGFATVVWFHGGGLTGGNRSVPGPMKEQGIAVVSAGYRLSPQVKSPAYFEEAASEELFVSVLVLGEIRQGMERIRLRDQAQAHTLEKWLRWISAGLIRTK